LLALLRWAGAAKQFGSTLHLGHVIEPALVERDGCLATATKLSRGRAGVAGPGCLSWGCIGWAHWHWPGEASRLRRIGMPCGCEIGRRRAVQGNAPQSAASSAGNLETAREWGASCRRHLPQALHHRDRGGPGYLASCTTPDHWRSRRGRIRGAGNHCLARGRLPSAYGARTAPLGGREDGHPISRSSRMAAPRCSPPKQLYGGGRIRPSWRTCARRACGSDAQGRDVPWSISAAAVRRANNRRRSRQVRTSCDGTGHRSARGGGMLIGRVLGNEARRQAAGNLDSR
jgi:hypothetical protein